jgi:hypothetical protein
MFIGALRRLLVAGHCWLGGGGSGQELSAGCLPEEQVPRQPTEAPVVDNSCRKLLNS